MFTIISITMPSNNFLILVAYMTFLSMFIQHSYIIPCTFLSLHLSRLIFIMFSREYNEVISRCRPGPRPSTPETKWCLSSSVPNVHTQLRVFRGISSCEGLSTCKKGAYPIKAVGFFRESGYLPPSDTQRHLRIPCYS